MRGKQGIRSKVSDGGPQSKRIKRSVAELLKLPKDVVCGDTVVCVLGREKVKVENYRSILVYSEVLIKLQAKANQVEIIGKHLRIRYYDKDEMEIVGKIECVRFI